MAMPCEHNGVEAEYAMVMIARKLVRTHDDLNQRDTIAIQRWLFVGLHLINRSLLSLFLGRCTVGVLVGQ